MCGLTLRYVQRMGDLRQSRNVDIDAKRRKEACNRSGEDDKQLGSRCKGAVRFGMQLLFYARLLCLLYIIALNRLLWKRARLGVLNGRVDPLRG